MHEFSVAQALMEIVAQEARRHQVEKVLKVGVKLGAFSHVSPQALGFCFEALKPGTVAAGAELLVERLSLKGRCLGCGGESPLQEPTDPCPFCGFERLKITQGRELYVAYIETDEPD